MCSNWAPKQIAGRIATNTDRRQRFGNGAIQELDTAIGVSSCFSDPRSPWQRDASENRKGLLRQCFPRATNFRKLSEEEIRKIVDLVQNHISDLIGEVLHKLKHELDAVQQGTEKPYQAVEEGLLPLDITLKERVHRHQARRQKETPLTQLGPKNIATFCKALKEKMRDKSSHFGKEYLRLLVDEIRVEGQEVRIRGSYAALAGMLQKTKVGLPEGVPTFGDDWLPILNDTRTLLAILAEELSAQGLVDFRD